MSKKSNKNLVADEIKSGKGADLFKVVVVLVINFEESSKRKEGYKTVQTSGLNVLRN